MIIPSEVVISGKTALNWLGLWTATALVQVRTQIHRDVILPVSGVHATEMEAITAAINTGAQWLRSHVGSEHTGAGRAQG